MPFLERPDSDLFSLIPRFDRRFFRVFRPSSRGIFLQGTPMTPTINTCEELASDRDRELANTAWKNFRERVDALFDEQLRTT